jgi:hypothetical protein
MSMVATSVNYTMLMGWSEAMFLVKNRVIFFEYPLRKDLSILTIGKALATTFEEKDLAITITKLPVDISWGEVLW